MSRSLISPQALGESLGKGDDHKAVDITTKFRKACAVRLRKEGLLLLNNGFYIFRLSMVKDWYGKAQ